MSSNIFTYLRIKIFLGTIDWSQVFTMEKPKQAVFFLTKEKRGLQYHDDNLSNPWLFIQKFLISKSFIIYGVAQE